MQMRALSFAALLSVAVPSLAALPLTARAAEPAEHPAELEDLTLANFFDGWSQPWSHRHRSTPDMALLKVTTNFLERELRLDYVRTDVRWSSKTKATDLANALIAYGLNRRLMVEVIGNEQWSEGWKGAPTNGAGSGALVRLQLVDTATQSWSAQARVSPPNRGVGQTQTSFTYALAGWQDLRALVPALGRTGLYWSAQLENLQGAHKAGGRENTVSYDVSLAHTWTEPATPALGNLTTFLEAYGSTDLDGSGSGKTVASLTPGVRFWFVPENSLMAGVDVPVSRGAPFSLVYRATYIMNF